MKTQQHSLLIHLSSSCLLLALWTFIDDVSVGVQRMEKNKYLLKRSQLLRCHITGRLPLISPRVRVLPNITPIQPYVGAIKEVAERYKTFLLFQRFVFCHNFLPRIHNPVRVSRSLFLRLHPADPN